MADPEPSSMLGAKFSIPYAVAAALVLGRTDVAAFEPGALADTRIRELARRVEVKADPEMSPRRTDHATARVKIAMRDGRILEESATVVKGDAADPVPAEGVVAKFLALASPVLGQAHAQSVVEAVHEAQAIKNIRHLTAWLVSAGPGAVTHLISLCP